MRQRHDGQSVGTLSGVPLLRSPQIFSILRFSTDVASQQPKGETDYCQDSVTNKIEDSYKIIACHISACCVPIAEADYRLQERNASEYQDDWKQQ